MVDNVTFTLRNNQSTDVTVSVVDMRTNGAVVQNAPLNKDESVPVTVAADSDARGAATWVFASSDGSVNSQKTQTGIRDGDACTLG